MNPVPTSPTYTSSPSGLCAASSSEPSTSALPVLGDQPAMIDLRGVPDRRLDPRPRPAPRLIGRDQSLRDHTLQALLRDRGQHDIAADVGEVGRHPQPGPLEIQAVQQFPSPTVGQLQQRSILAMQQVEHDVLHRHPLDQLRGGCRDVHAVLQQAEVRAAVPVQRDELAVDDHTLAQLECGDLRVGAGDVPIVAAVQRQPATSGVADRADPVELDLERPPRARPEPDPTSPASAGSTHRLADR